RMKEAVIEHARDPFRDDVWSELAGGIRYVAADFTDAAAVDRVAEALTELDAERGSAGNRVYYLAVPPSAFLPIVGRLGEARTAGGWTRLIVEKPFGHDRVSAAALDAALSEHFDESEIFRIDHYLGKETVQNMLALRFAN